MHEQQRDTLERRTKNTRGPDVVPHGAHARCHPEHKPFRKLSRSMEPLDKQEKARRLA